MISIEREKEYELHHNSLSRNSSSWSSLHLTSTCTCSRDDADMKTYSSQEAFRLSKIDEIIINSLNAIVADILDQDGMAPIVRFENATNGIDKTSYIWSDEEDSYIRLTY